jgi:HK97 family phage prohead protease
MSASFEERRISSDRVMVDAAVDRHLRGRAVTFNSWSKVMLDKQIGPFRERILSSAVDRVMASGAEVKALWNHNDSDVIGSRRAGTLLLHKSPQGLMIDIDPPKWASRYVETVERGDVDAMSFNLLVPPDGEEWDYRTSDGIPTRSVHDMVFREISIVPFPAYDNTSVEVSQRSIEFFLAHKPDGPVYDWRSRFSEIMRNY